MTRPIAPRIAHTGTTKPASPPTCATDSPTNTPPASRRSDQRPQHDGLRREPPQQHDVELGGADQRDRAGAEHQREGLLVEPVAALQDERRAGDVGEQAGHAERGDQHQDDEPRVAQQLDVGGGDAAHPQRPPVRRRQRLGQRQRGEQQQQHRPAPPARRTPSAMTPCSSTAAPSDGATTGATPSTSISRDMHGGGGRFGEQVTDDGDRHHHGRGRADALQDAGQARARPMFGASMQSTDATMCSTMPAISGRLRPSESDSGPTIS